MRRTPWWLWLWQLLLQLVEAQKQELREAACLNVLQMTQSAAVQAGISRHLTLQVKQSGLLMRFEL